LGQLLVTILVLVSLGLKPRQSRAQKGQGFASARWTLKQGVLFVANGLNYRSHVCGLALVWREGEVDSAAGNYLHVLTIQALIIY
jgi:hypothetical protein